MSENLSLDELQQDYQRKLAVMFAEHEKQMVELTTTLNRRIAENEVHMREALDRMQSMSEAPVENEEPTNADKPIAFWMMVEGSRVLVLNESAAQTQMQLLEGIGKLLDQFRKLRRY